MESILNKTTNPVVIEPPVSTIISAPSEPVVQSVPEAPIQVFVESREPTVIEYSDVVLVRGVKGWRILRDGWSQSVNGVRTWQSYDDVNTALETWRRTR